MKEVKTPKKYFLTLIDHDDDLLKAAISNFSNGHSFDVLHFDSKQEVDKFLQEEVPSGQQLILYTTLRFAHLFKESPLYNNTNLHLIIESEKDFDLPSSEISRLESVLTIPTKKRSIVDFEKLYEAIRYKSSAGLGYFVGDNEMVFKHIVSSKQDKREVLDELHKFIISKSTPKTLRVFEDYARASVELLDELLLNSIFNANPSFTKARRNVDFSLPASEQIIVKWAANAQVFAISVTDPFGSLQKQDAFGYALDAVVTPFDEKTSGGRGLRMVYERLNSLILNVDENRKTEVICLITLSNRITRYKTKIKSIHFKDNKET